MWREKEMEFHDFRPKRILILKGGKVKNKNKKRQTRMKNL
jgi:hypothetical protein